MTSIILFVICLLASSIGAIVGAGGGVIIKPVVDMFGILENASVTSFCAGCTVLAMSVSSLIRTRNNGVKLEVRTSTFLAVGAVCGGLIGNALLSMVKAGGTAESLAMLKMTQSIVQAVITLGVLLYVSFKAKLPSYHVKNPAAIVLAGLCLGVISSFLGIGGGTSNVAVLTFCFSMDSKQAAKNSIYIIVFSQISSITQKIIGGNVPDFAWMNLIGMVCGGVGGALVGASVSKRIDNSGVDKIMKVLLAVIILICIYNAYNAYMIVA